MSEYCRNTKYKINEIVHSDEFDNNLKKLKKQSIVNPIDFEYIFN